MAGILDDVMGGIAAKEKQAGTPPKEGEKPMHSYSDDFKEKYGDGKGKRA